VRRLAVVFVASGLAILLARDGLHIPYSTHSFATADRAVLALAADLDRAGRRLRLSEAQQSAWETFTAAKAEALFSRHAAALTAFRASAERLQAVLTAEQRRLAGNLLEGPQPWMFPLSLSPVARL
jgi:hypothetical protein